MKNLPTAAAWLLAALALAACEKKGAMEELGEDIDEAVEEVEQAVDDACEEIKDDLNAEDKDC